MEDQTAASTSRGSRLALALLLCPACYAGFALAFGGSAAAAAGAFLLGNPAWTAAGSALAAVGVAWALVRRRRAACPA